MKHEKFPLTLIFVFFIMTFSLISLKAESMISSQAPNILIAINSTDSTQTRRIVVQSTEFTAQLGLGKSSYDTSRWANDRVAIDSSVSKFNANVVKEYPKYFYKLIDVQEKDYDNLTQDLRSKGYTVWDDTKLHIELDKSVPLMEGIVPYWSGNLNGNQVRIAVIDTGIDDTHPDFGGRFGQPGSRIINWTDATDENFSTPIDQNGHGTVVASIAAGSGAASNGKYKGVAPGALLLIAKAGKNDGSLEDDDAADAVDWAVQQGAQIISLSSGEIATIDECTGSSSAPANARRLFNSINAAIARGIFVVVAAGNSGPMPQTIEFPGCMRDVITVGAVLNEDTYKTESVGMDFWSSVSESAVLNSRVYLNGFIKDDFEGTGTNLRSDNAYSGTGIQLLLNPTSVKNLYPVSCLSETGDEVYGDKYSEDAIASYDLTANSCKVVADDTIGDGEHNRRVGAVCSGATTTVSWTDWQTSNDDVATFYGNDCPAGTHAIACLTDSATSESESNYGDDDVMTIFIDSGKCMIVADDTRGGSEQKRKVGTVCSNIKTEELVHGFDTSNDGNPVFYSPSCPSGMHPISCLTYTDTPESQADYGEDDVVSMTFEDNRCRIMATDTVGNDEHKRVAGVVCTNDTSALSVQWSNWDYRDSSIHDGADSKVETFSGDAPDIGTCPTGTRPVFCLTETGVDSWNDADYGEDDIMETTLENNKCKVVANDVVGGFEQKRKVEAIASEIPSTVSWTDWQTSNKKVETFYGSTCPTGTSPISCLTETDEEDDSGKYGEDNVLGITITSDTHVCKVAANDVTGGSEQKRKVGTVCSSISSTTYWTDWQTRSNDVASFRGPSCPSGQQAISCLTESANDESEQYYGEDDILTLTIKNNACEVESDDTTGNFEQKRKVGTVCIDSSIPLYHYKILNWVKKNNDDSTFYSTPIPQPLQILVQGQYKNGGDSGWSPGEKVKHDEFWSFTQSFSPGDKINIEIGGLPSTSSTTHFDPSNSNTFYFKSWVDSFGNKDRVAIYSSRGPPIQDATLMKPNILAPAHLTCAARATGTDFGDECDSFTASYHKMGGTSAATPHVSGAIALLLDANPRATYNEILSSLYEGAVKRNSYDPASDYDKFAEGSGRVDVKNSVSNSKISRCYDYTGTLTLSPKNLGSSTTVRASMNAPNCTSKLGKIVRQSDGAVMCTATTYHGYAECIFDTGLFIGTQSFAFVIDDKTIATDTVNRSPKPCSGDITGPTKWVPDGIIDMRDVGLISSLFNAQCGNLDPSKPKYDSRADLDKNCIIDMRDIGTVASQFGKISC